MKDNNGTKIVVVAIVVLSLGLLLGYNIASKTIEPKEVIVEKPVEKIVRLPREVKKRVVTIEEVESKLEEMAELTTYSGRYKVRLGKDETRYILDDLKIWGTTNSITIDAEGIVKVGYDIEDIGVEIKNYTIYISLPEAKINDNYVIWDTVNCVEKNNILNPISFSQYQEIISEIEKKGLDDVEKKDIYKKAEKNVKKVINGFFSEFVDYKIVYI